MPDPTPTRDRAAGPPPGTEYDKLTSYEDGDSLVICDREEPHAWIRSDRAVDVRR